MTRRVLLAAALSAISTSAAAQVPAGGEFTVNTYTTGHQLIYAMTPLAVGPRGDFVVAWESEDQESPGSFGVFAQRFDASGARRGAEFHVNQFTSGFQGEASVAFLGRRGHFVVVWESEGVDGFQGGVCARVYDATGAAQTPEFLVNTFTLSDQSRPAVAAAAAGNFVVVWSSHAQDGKGAGVFGQRFGPAGNRLGAEFAVNTHTTSFQTNAAVAFTASGQFVVTWASYGQDGSGYGLFAQRFDAAGSRLGAEFQVNTSTDGPQGYHSAIAPAAGGGFVVTWDDFRLLSVIDIVGQRFDSAGARLGSEFLVNTLTTGTQFRSRVASNARGDFTVAWVALGPEAAPVVSAQRFDAGGARRGGEFRASASTEQSFPGLGVDAAGNFVVAWSERTIDGSGYATRAQRFGGLLPAALAVDPSGNGVLEPGESPAVRPSWRNVNGATQTFWGTLLDVTGPPGATYGLPDPDGSYGTVPDGTTRECSDCYAVSVSNPPARPVLHWDAVATEGITPDAQGQRYPWRLHVGSSFTDVPGANPFYRFVETLLHHQITGGCSATTFCPADSTTREQMAVFVLVAKEGAGYAPVPCATPVFADVPPGSVFCRWIEELARRGVVSGCGGGNYCPSQAVTREQMAIFVLRTLDPALDPPACATPVFADVPASSPFCRWIEELARRGVVGGCGGGNYCPADPVTREQMSVFISITFGLTLYGP